MIDEIFLKERLKELENQRDKAVATLNAVDGALQECEMYLRFLEKENLKNNDTEL